MSISDTFFAMASAVPASKVPAASGKVATALRILIEEVALVLSKQPSKAQLLTDIITAAITGAANVIVEARTAEHSQYRVIPAIGQFLEAVKKGNADALKKETDALRGSSHTSSPGNPSSTCSQHLCIRANISLIVRAFASALVHAGEAQTEAEKANVRKFADALVDAARGLSVSMTTASVSGAAAGRRRGRHLRMEAVRSQYEVYIDRMAHNVVEMHASLAQRLK